MGMCLDKSIGAAPGRQKSDDAVVKRRLLGADGQLAAIMRGGSRRGGLCV